VQAQRIIGAYGIEHCARLTANPALIPAEIILAVHFDKPDRGPGFEKSAVMCAAQADAIHFLRSFFQVLFFAVISW
jgi:hypothetical protein